MKHDFPLDATSPEPDSFYGKVSFPTQAIEEQKLINGVINARLDMMTAPRMKEEIDFNKLRDLLFSIRDNGVYCPLCRAPEFSPSPTMRSSHYEDCALGLMCEQLLRLYPRDNYVVKWRK